jgi:hypothetical protein
MSEHLGTRKKIMFYIAMTGLTLAVCVFVLEFIVARFYYSDVYLVSDTVFDPDLGWLLRPGVHHAKAPNRFGKHRIYINEHGLRNGDIGAAPSEGLRRIIILGDSFTYGKAIRDECLFPRRIERALNDDAASPRSEIVNAGIPGYGSAQELLLMRRLAARGVTGDCYMLVMFPNDNLDNLRLFYANLAENPLQPGLAIGEDGELVLAHPPERTFGDESENFAPAAKSLDRMKIDKVLRLRVESYLQSKPRLIRSLTRIGVRVKLPSMPGLLNAWYRDDIVARGVPLMRRILHAMREEARHRGAPLLVCLIPSQIQVYFETYGTLLKETFPDSGIVDRWLADPLKPQRLIASICDELGIPFMDLLPSLGEHTGGALYIPREGHLSEEGHALVARCLARFLTDHANGGTSARAARNGNGGGRP